MHPNSLPPNSRIFLSQSKPLWDWESGRRVFQSVASNITKSEVRTNPPPPKSHQMLAFCVSFQRKMQRQCPLFPGLVKLPCRIGERKSSSCWCVEVVGRGCHAVEEGMGSQDFLLQGGSCVEHFQRSRLSVPTISLGKSLLLQF